MTCAELTRVQPQYKRILEGNRAQGFPVKLGALADALGVKVLVANLQPGVSGQIRREEGHYVIRLNRHEARERQRFTLAHELAHFLLHRDLIDRSLDGITDNVLYRSGAEERVEYEANRLAAEIVMPETLVRERLNSLGGRVTSSAIDALAEQFQVSKAAMEIRLQQREFA